jgi:hypothetical protein
MDLASPVTFYDLKNITDEDLKKLREMLETGYVQEALDMFTREYITAPAEDYQDTMVRYLDDADDDIYSIREKNNMLRNVSLLTIGLSSLLISNFKKFVKDSYSESVFQSASMRNPDAKKIILDEVISKFEQTTTGALARTNSFVSSSIHALQKESILENLKVKRSGIAGEVLAEEHSAFQKLLKDKYPDIYKAINNGNIVTIQKMSKDGITTTHFKLDYYIEMAVRDIILNVDRNAVLSSALINEERVVEYFLADPRHVKQDRIICQEILHKLTLGKALLGTDDEISRLLGIMSITEAQSQSALSWNCRHSFKRVSKEFLKEIDKLIG